jgi:hypothetical protein
MRDAATWCSQASYGALALQEACVLNHLCFVQMEYPRTKRIRKRWLLRRVTELAVFLGLMLFLVDQYVEPAILNSLVRLLPRMWTDMLVLHA